MALPQNTAIILQFMFPGVEAKLFGVSSDPGKIINGEIIRLPVTSIEDWQHNVTQPTEQEIIAVGNSPEFAVWLANRQDPIKSSQIATIDKLKDTNDPTIKLIRVQTKILQKQLSILTNKLNETITKLNLLLSAGSRVTLTPTIDDFSKIVTTLENQITAGAGETSTNL